MLADRAHKIKMHPAEDAETLRRMFLQTQAVRHVFVEWNREMYALWKADSKNNPYPRYTVLLRRWTKEKPECGSLLSRSSITKIALNVCSAYDNHRKNPKHFKLPDYTKKRDVHKWSFYVDNAHTHLVGDDRVYIPKVGAVRLAEKFRFPGSKIMSYTFTWDGVDMYCVSQTRIEKPILCTNKSTVGVDVGLGKIAVASDGSMLEYPKGFDRANKRVLVEQKKLSNKVQGSNNFKKQYKRLKKAYKRKDNIINDALHKYTTQLCKTHNTVVTEDLFIAGLIQTSPKWHRRHFTFSQMKKLIWMVSYKATDYRAADRFFPSSKTCSNCGHRKADLQLSERTYVCPNCGLTIDRDLNAAHNLRQYIAGHVEPDLR